VAVMYSGRVVETGTTDSLFAAPTHPYTRGLLASLPDIDDPATGHDRVDLLAMPGLPPDPVDPPAGCAFAPRCPIAHPDCVGHPQQLREVGPDHAVASRCPVPRRSVEQQEVARG